jgi:hypothetical protein
MCAVLPLVRRLDREVEYSPIYNVEIKNLWGSIHAVPYVAMAWWLKRQIVPHLMVWWFWRQYRQPVYRLDVIRLTAWCIFMFRIILTINPDYFTYTLNRLVILVEIRCAFVSKIGTVLLYIIWRHLTFRQFVQNSVTANLLYASVPTRFLFRLSLNSEMLHRSCFGTLL